MKKVRIMTLMLGLFLFSTLSAQIKEKEFAFNNYFRYSSEAKAYKGQEKLDAIQKLRLHFAKHPQRVPKQKLEMSIQECLALITPQGTFRDLDPQEAKLRENDIFHTRYHNTTDDVVGLFLEKALNRVYFIAEAYSKGNLSIEEAMSEKVLKAILHYGMIEVQRANDYPRFHASCFAIPTAAVNIYFAFLTEMEEVENGTNQSALLKEACEMLKVLGLEAYTQPLRNNETDNNVVSLARFQGDGWWVGGNAIGYRSLLPVAAMYRSVPMVDLLAEICQRGISMASQSTFDEAFWTEGFTADGAGWGHGKQCLIWGYPIDGTSKALSLLNLLAGSPWAKQLTKANTQALMNFFRGGNWYYYKGYRLTGLDRGSYVYNPKETNIAYTGMLNNVVSNWIDSFTPAEQEELKNLQKEVKNRRIDMQGYAPGIYSGTRWFFNNDDLMKKTPDYLVSVNMASFRCDGLESAAFADNYNFYPTDGATLFERTGNEYYRIMGALDFTALSGITAREGMDKLNPVTNWRGYCSKHNYATGATDGGDYAVGGYIFEKINGSDKKFNEQGKREAENEILYGFKAYKGYFIFEDYVVALGSGITNLRPTMEGNIRTSIDQTSWHNATYILNKGRKNELTEGEYTFPVRKKNPTWLVQEGQFAYTVLSDYVDDVKIALKEVPTTWVKRNPANAKKDNLPATSKILHMWVDHGQKPVNDTYGYVVYTGKGKPGKTLPFEVLRNDTLVQAMRSTDGKVLEAVFYPNNNGLHAKKLSLEVSSPSSLLIKDLGKSWSISVNDATMNEDLKQLEVIFNNRRILVDLPQGLYCGKPVTVIVDK